MTCTRCGHQIPAGDRFCGGCGASLAQPGATRVGNSSPTEFHTDSDQTRLGTGSLLPLDPDQTGLGIPGQFSNDATQLVNRAGPVEREGSKTVARSGASPDQGPLKPGQPFAGRYHIVRLLGLGGMGAVYQAWDDALAVVVALKVIRPEITRDPEAAQTIERR